MLLDVLYRIHANPNEHLGCRSLERLYAFETGYGRPAKARDFPVEDIFRDWLISVYRPHWDVEAMNAFWIIQKIAQNDERGYDLYFKNLDAALAAHPEALQNPTIVDERNDNPLALSCYLEIVSSRTAFHLPRPTPGCLRAYLDGRRLALLEEGHFECADLEGFEHWVRKTLELKGMFRWEEAALTNFLGREEDAFRWSLQELKAYRMSLGALSKCNPLL